MFFDYSGCANCYRGISVDPRFRPDSASDERRNSNNNCCHNHPNARPDNDKCHGRPDTRPDNDNCHGRPDTRPDNDNCHDRPDIRPDNDNCHGRPDTRPENRFPNDSADKNDCCTDGVMAVLSFATRALGRDDTVDVEITLSGGYTQVVTLGRGTSTIISGDILRTPQGAISLCEITKIRLLSSSVSDPDYMQRLQNALERFIGEPRRRSQMNGCSNNDCDSCVEAMQRYIMRNADDIDALLFDGSQSATATVVTGTVTTSVITEGSIDTETASFVSSAELTSGTVEAVTAVTASETEVVTAVELLPSSIISAVTTETAEVSGPVTVTDTEVVGSIDTTEAAEFASAVTVAETAVVGSITTETASVVSGFTDSDTVSGVISGLTGAVVNTATAVNIPIFNSVGTGALQVIIPAGSFGTNIPATNVTLPITIDGIGISYGGTNTVYALSDAATLLSITGVPAVTDIPLLGTPSITTVISAVTADEATVVGEATFESVSGSLVTDVTTVSVGSAAQPETVESVTAVTTEFSEINAVGTVSTVDASDLFAVDTAAVISDVQLSVTSDEAVTSVEFSGTSADVISGITTEDVTVASPSFADPVDGDIIGARRGIIAVDNTDGDISVYSSCAVRGAQTGTSPQL